MDSFTTRAEVSHLETHLIFEHVRRPTLPNYALPEPEPAPRPGRTTARKAGATKRPEGARRR